MNENENDKQADPVGNPDCWRCGGDGCSWCKETHPAQPVQPAGAQSWEPIETAPKDNKRALYLARFNESGELVGLDFNGAWEYWQESWELAHINGYAWVSENGIEEPTHWAYQDLPLPKSLSAPAGAQEPVFYAHALCLEQCGKGEITGLHGHNRKACDEDGEVLVPLYREAPAAAINEQLLEVLKEADAVFEYVHRDPKQVRKIVKVAIAAAEAAKKGGA